MSLELKSVLAPPDRAQLIGSCCVCIWFGLHAQDLLFLCCMQPMVSADGSDPRGVKQWQRQQAAESDLAAAEEAVKAGQKVCALVLQYCCETVKCFLLCVRLLKVSADMCVSK